MYAPGIPDKKQKTSIPRAENATWQLNLQEHDAERAGCFMPSARVKMADNTLKYIRDIKIGDLVKSFNPQTKKVEDKKVIRVWENGSTDFWHKLYLNKRNGCTSTPNHKIFIKDKRTDNLYKIPAKDIDPNSHEVLREDRGLSQNQKDFLIGSLLGDSSIPQNYTGTPAFNWGQASKKELVEYFSEKFATNTELRKARKNRSDFYYFRFKHEYFHTLSELFYKDGTKVIKDELFKFLTPAAIAQWFMDDGQWSPQSSNFKKLERNTKRRSDAGVDPYSGNLYLYTNGFTEKEVEKLQHFLNTRYSLSFTKRERDGYYYLCSSAIASNKLFFNIVSKFIQPEFSYKLPNTYNKIKTRPHFESFLEFNTVYPRPVLKKERYRTKQGKNKNQKLSLKKFDLEVEGNHNYFISGILVSNSHTDLRLSPPGSSKAYS